MSRSAFSFCNFAAQPLDLGLLGLHLPLARKGLRRIGRKLPHPIAQHVRVQVQITRRLRNRNPALAHQPHRLELELAAETPSSHLPPPVPS